MSQGSRALFPLSLVIVSGLWITFTYSAIFAVMLMLRCFGFISLLVFFLPFGASLESSSHWSHVDHADTTKLEDRQIPAVIGNQNFLRRAYQACRSFIAPGTGIPLSINTDQKQLPLLASISTSMEASSVFGTVMPLSTNTVRLCFAVISQLALLITQRCSFNNTVNRFIARLGE